MTVGLTISTAAAIINLVVGLWFVRLGRRCHSRALEADGRHLLTDVATSAGVVGGLGLAAPTGWERLDPLVAMTIGVNIVVTGSRVLWGRSAGSWTRRSRPTSRTPSTPVWWSTRSLTLPQASKRT